MSATCSDRSRPAVPIDVGRVASARWSGFVSHPSVVASSGNAVDRSLLAEGVAPELETMGIVDDAVEDGVGEGGIAEHDVTPQYRNDYHA